MIILNKRVSEYEHKDHKNPFTFLIGLISHDKIKNNNEFQDIVELLLQMTSKELSMLYSEASNAYRL